MHELLTDFIIVAAGIAVLFLGLLTLFEVCFGPMFRGGG